MRQGIRIDPRGEGHADLGVGFVGFEVDDACHPFVLRERRVEPAAHRDLTREHAGILDAAVSGVVAGLHAPSFRRPARNEPPLDTRSLGTCVRIACKDRAVAAWFGQIALTFARNRAVGGAAAGVSNVILAPRYGKTGKQ